MKHYITLLLVFVFALAINAKAQQPVVTKSFEITAEAHGFKCPFLSPKYIQRIQGLDSCKVWKTPDLVIHVEFNKPTTVDGEQLIATAVKTGYERKNITVKEIVK